MLKEFYKIKKISKNIYLLSEPWFDEYANFYLIKKEDSTLLFDCGLGLFNLKAFLNRLGFGIDAVMLTHSHFDHCGGAVHFCPEKIIANEKILRNLKNRKYMGIEHLKEEYFSKELLKSLPFEKIRKDVGDGEKFGDIKPYKQDNIFGFNIISLPGHTDDSTVFYSKKDKLLITGDVLYDGEIYASLINSDEKKFINSLNYIKKLDFDIVLPGHNNILSKQQAIKIINKWINILEMPAQRFNLLNAESEKH